MTRTEQASWKEVVAEALSALGGEAHLSQIYDRLKDHPKTTSNPTWRDTIRRVVRQYNVFEPVPPERSGVYRLVPGAVIAPVPSRFEGQTAELDHATAQGMLVTLGAVYGYETFVPKTDQATRQFQGRPLAEMVSVRDCDEALHSANIRRIREIDVLWFEEDEDGLYPVFAFEVEHTTKVKEGLDRLLKIPARYQARLFIIGPNEDIAELFRRLLTQEPFRSHRDRFTFRSYQQLQALHNSATEHHRLREAFGVSERSRQAIFE